MSGNSMLIKLCLMSACLFECQYLHMVSITNEAGKATTVFPKPRCISKLDKTESIQKSYSLISWLIMLMV